MFSSANVPNEVWAEIFSYVALQNKDSCRQHYQALFKIACTNRHLRGCVQTLLWSQIGLDNKDSKFILRISRLLKVLEQRRDFQDCIKSLDFMTNDVDLDEVKASSLTNTLLDHTPNLASLAVDAWLLDSTILELSSLNTIYLLLPSSLDRAQYEENMENADVFPHIVSRVLTMPSLRTVHIEDRHDRYGWRLESPTVPIGQYFGKCLPESSGRSTVESLSYTKRLNEWFQVGWLMLQMRKLTRLSLSPSTNNLGLGLLTSNIAGKAGSIQELILGPPVMNMAGHRVHFLHDDHYSGIAFRYFLHLTSLGLTLDLTGTFVKPLSALLPPNLKTLQLGFKYASSRPGTPRDFPGASRRIQRALASIPIGAKSGLHKGLKNVICWLSKEDRLEGTEAWPKLEEELSMLWHDFDQMGVKFKWLLGGVEFEQTPLVTGKELSSSATLDLQSSYWGYAFSSLTKEEDE